MKKNLCLWEKLADKTDLLGEAFPDQPLIEIIGEYRVLVENHCGVKEYGRERIGIKVKFGIALICGSCLELTRMTKEQLVVSGKIESISLIRRC